MILANFVRNKLSEFKSNYPTKKAGVVASWLVLSTPDLGSSSGWVHCVFLGKTLDSRSATLSTRCTCVQMGTGEFNAGGNPVID